MGKASKDKGKRWERAVARMFRDAGIPATRGDQSSGPIDPDVDVAGLWLECKHGKAMSPRAALRQAMNDAPSGRIPVGVVRDHNDGKGVPPFVVLTLADFIRIWGKE